MIGNSEAMIGNSVSWAGGPESWEAWSPYWPEDCGIAFTTAVTSISTGTGTGTGHLIVCLSLLGFFSWQATTNVAFNSNCHGAFRLPAGAQSLRSPLTECLVCQRQRGEYYPYEIQLQQAMERELLG